MYWLCKLGAPLECIHPLLYPNQNYLALAGDPLLLFINLNWHCLARLELWTYVVLKFRHKLTQVQVKLSMRGNKLGKVNGLRRSCIS